MTKKEIVKKISDEAKLTQLKTKEIVQMTFDAIVETLVTEGRIDLRNFGVFEVKTRKPRRARNPRTNEPVDVDAKNVVTFQPGKVMEERVRKMPAPGPGRPARKVEEEDDDTDDLGIDTAPAGADSATRSHAHAPRVLVNAGVEDAGPLKPR